MFRFKKFAVTHGKGSMKVGVDAVLLGAWAGERACKILDVGTGCGVISLLLAQRFPEAKIDAIDIDIPSVEEASDNFSKSVWKNNLKVWRAQFPNDLEGATEKYDLIVSNPPYFLSGIVSPMTQRERARHQDTLSVFSLLEFAPGFLSEDGVLAIICPSEFETPAIEKSSISGLYIKRICRIKDREGKKGKRIMMEFQCKKTNTIKEEELTLFKGGAPTEAYKYLCRDFYLKF